MYYYIVKYVSGSVGGYNLHYLNFLKYTYEI